MLAVKTVQSEGIPPGAGIPEQAVKKMLRFFFPHYLGAWNLKVQKSPEVFGLNCSES